MLNCSDEHSLSPCFIQQILNSLFLTGLGTWGDGTMPQPLQNWHLSTVNVPMVSLYAWGARGVYWLFQNEVWLLFFMLHFPYIFSLNCCYLFISQDIHRIMQCKYLLWTLGDMWQNLDDERTNLSCIYCTIYFWDDYVKILLCCEILALSELATNLQPTEQCGMQWIAFICNLWALSRTVAS